MNQRMTGEDDSHYLGKSATKRRVMLSHTYIVTTVGFGFVIHTCGVRHINSARVSANNSQRWGRGGAWQPIHEEEYMWDLHTSISVCLRAALVNICKENIYHGRAPQCPKTQKHTQEQLLSRIVWEGRVIWRGFEISPAFALFFLFFFQWRSSSP